MATRPPSSMRLSVRVDAAPLLFAVDEDESSLELILRALGGAYRVRTFDTALRAVTAAKEEPPAILITSFRMPNIDGIGLLRSLKQAGIEPIVLIAAFDGDMPEVARVEQEEQLFVRTLPKPWKAADLRAQVDLAVGLYNLQLQQRP